jgi:hypothetical protein
MSTEVGFILSLLIVVGGAWSVVAFMVWSKRHHKHGKPSVDASVRHV